MSENNRTSGHDLDVWGGKATAPVLVPQAGSAGNDCPCQVDDRCPRYCNACVVFLEEMARLVPTDTTGPKEMKEIVNHQ